MLRIALADDEPLARARLARLLREAGCEVLAELPDGPSLLEWMATAPNLDALFLDIHMPGASGLELVAELKDPPPVVFVTAYSEHAVRAFETDVVDYVLKPISAERLEKTLAKLRRREVPRRSQTELKTLSNRVPVKAGEGHVFLDLRKVSHFEVEDEEVWAWTPTRDGALRHLTDWASLGDVEAAFPGAGLVRIQRHLLLRPEAILGLKPLEGGRASVRVAEGLDLEVSRSVTPRLKEWLGL